MAFEGLGGNPWNVKIQLSEDPEYIPIASARGAFQVVNSGTLFALFGLTCFMRYGIPCVARRGRFQGEVYHFKTLSFAMITYAICSALEGSEYLAYVTSAVVTFGWYWVSMLAELFRSFAYCSTFFTFYRSIHWFLERIHKESKILPFIKIGRWVIYALTCSFTAASWAYFVFYNVFTVESTEVEKFAHYDRVWTKLLATRRIIWWLVSLEITAWLSYSAFKVYKSEHRAARNAGVFALFGSVVFSALSFMWAVVAMRWELTLTEASWGMGNQLAVVVLELFLTTTAYLGVLLMCMKLAVLGHDLDDKACEPTVWTEEEKTQSNSQDVSRPVSPIDEEAGFGTSAEMSGSMTKGPSYQVSEMIGSSKNVPEMEGSSENVVEMDAVRPTVEAEGSTQHVIEMDASRSVVEVEGSSKLLLEMEGSTKHCFEMHGSTHQALEADSGVYHQDLKGQGA